MAKDTKELNPRVEAQRVEEAAKQAERKRLYERARTVPLRGPAPELTKAQEKKYRAYVAGEETYTPDGKLRKPGDVFLVKRELEPSQTWCPLEEHISQTEES